MSGGERVVLLRCLGYFVVGSQPRFLERLAATAAGCCCLGVPELIIEETYVHRLIQPLIPRLQRGRVDPPGKHSGSVAVHPAQGWPLSNPKAASGLPDTQSASKHIIFKSVSNLGERLVVEPGFGVTLDFKISDGMRDLVAQDYGTADDVASQVTHSELVVIWSTGVVSVDVLHVHAYGSSGEPPGVGRLHLLDSDALFSLANKDVSLSVLSHFSYNGVV